MSLITEPLSQEIAIPAAGLFPKAYATGTSYTSYVDMGSLAQLEARLDIGAGLASGTMDFALYGCSVTGGTYSLISGTSMTQLSGTAMSNLSATILITAPKLQSLGLNYRYVKAGIIIGTSSAFANLSLRGSGQHYSAAAVSGTTGVAYTNDASVTQQILLVK